LELCRLKHLISVGDLLKQAESGATPTPPPAPRSAPPPPKTSYEAPPAPKPAVAQEGEPIFAVDEIEDPAEAEKNPEMAKLKSQWMELLEKVGAQKSSLKGILVDTRPKKLEEGTLVLACKGPFHLEQISKSENKVLVEKLLEEIVGRKINLVPVLPERTASSPEKPTGLRTPKPLSAPKIDVKELEKEEPMVAAALKMFGGKIVEIKRNNPQK
ncbi:MAG TPA: hypothetical protein VIJ93_01600, partial [bacterium]